MLTVNTAGSNIRGHFNGIQGNPHQISGNVHTRLAKVLRAQRKEFEKEDVEAIKIAGRNILGVLDEARELLTLDGDNRYWKELVAKSGDLKTVGEIIRDHDRFSRTAYDAVQVNEAGNSRVMDEVYYCDWLNSQIPDSDPLSKGLHFASTNFSAACDARNRREWIAHLIDDYLVSDETLAKEPKILSVAAGRFREVELSEVLSTAENLTFIPLDVDEHSLELASRCYGGLVKGEIKPEKMDFRALIKNQGLEELGGYDLAYSLGLYDYLKTDSSVAQRLTTYLFKNLNPGGKLVLANYWQSESRGMLEGVMDWWLVFRDYNDMTKLVEDLPPEEVESINLYKSALNDIIYLEVVKKGELERESFVPTFSKEPNLAKRNDEPLLEANKTTHNIPSLYDDGLSLCKLRLDIKDGNARLLVCAGTTQIDSITCTNSSGEDIDGVKALTIEDEKAIFPNDPQTKGEDHLEPLAGIRSKKGFSIPLKLDESSNFLEKPIISITTRHGEKALVSLSNNKLENSELRANVLVEKG